MKQYKIPSSWLELSPWQCAEIAHLYLSADPDDFAAAYREMIFILFQIEDSRSAKRRLTKLVNNVPISELEKRARFLTQTTNHYSFPIIKGLIAPAVRLTDISIRQFSTIDTFFFTWNKNRTLTNLNRLVASLYRVKKEYSDLDLPEVGKITSKIPEKQKSNIALGYIFTRKHITEKFPIVFPPPPKEEENLVPVFGSKSKPYIPFDKAIVAMAMEELQPLGKKQDIDKVSIYEFFSVMSENIRYHKEKAKQTKS